MGKLRIRTLPGEVLLEDFMRPLGLSANALAHDLHVPPNRITSIVASTTPRAITPDAALRLARYFGTTPQFWLNLQSAHDLSLAECAIGERVAEEMRPRAA